VCAPSAHASHYLLADVPDVVPKDHHAALRKAGVVNTKQLYERTAARKDRRALAVVSGLPVRELARWARFMDLMQLNGIGPKMVRLLNAAGVRTLRDLKGAVADSLQPKMRAANRGAKYSEIVPSVGVVRGWIGNAAKVKPRLE